MIKFRYMNWDDVYKEFALVDESDVLERAKSSPALQQALDISRPINWHGTGAGEDMLKVARSESLSLAWVPRSEILIELNEAKNSESRNNILIARENQILDDCEEALNECKYDELFDNQELALCSIRAMRSGHRETGLGLAACIGEALAQWASIPRVQSFENDEARKSGRTPVVTKRLELSSIVMSECFLHSIFHAWC